MLNTDVKILRILILLDNQTVTYHVQLKTFINNGTGYINYVFEDLEYKDYDYQYITATRFPNWEHGHINVGDIGYVTLKCVREGIDQWYDGEKLITFNNDMWIFIRFIPEKESISLSEIILD